MSNPIPNAIEVKIVANLKTIIEYHPASESYLNDDTLLKYEKKIVINQLQEDIDGLIAVHPNYRYNDIINDELHSNNLLLIVQNLIDFEGAYYHSYTVFDENSEFQVNFHRELLPVLKDLMVVNTIIENESFNDLQNILKVKNAGIDIKEMRIEIVFREEKLQILNLIKKNRLEQLLSSPYPISTYFTGTRDLKIANLNEVKSSEIQSVIKRLEQPFNDKAEEPKKLFINLVIRTLEKYFKGAMKMKNPDEFSDYKGVITHTLLSIFNLIDHKVSLTHISVRDKAEYIRSLKRERKYKIENIYNMEVIPLDKLSDYPGLTL